ncbi:hypothetical protein [Acinetobacter larvae]|uniref:Uncharacterized protein n=1 Tax=Acinetobacter larvae TaxID=1789224 RepID=A0A1B2M2R1_9GAMM|nr:hypothetical protein [Acinetobacter larvae]AOA59474.1 hypothetical protein BFG52_14715 [Acinetobacter larvae]
MLICKFKKVPDFITIETKLKSYEGFLALDNKEKLNKILLEYLNNISNKNIEIYLIARELNLIGHPKMIDFKGALGSKNLLNYNKNKIYSEKFYLNTELCFFDIVQYNPNSSENTELFNLGYNTDLCFIKVQDQYVFFLNFLDSSYGLLFLNNSFNLSKNYDEIDIIEAEKFYNDFHGNIQGMLDYITFLNLDPNSKQVIKNINN